MKRARLFLLVCALVLVAAVAVAWLSRFRIARMAVAGQLAKAHVPATYRITRIGPFAERMEDVVIGDPARPDLIARQIDVTVGYGPSGPVVTGVAVDGVRLRARLDGDGLHLGAIDRLLPKGPGGKIRLPDLDVRLSDSRMALATPNGAIDLAMTGAGNPARSFQGSVAVDGAALRLAACTLRDARAVLAVAIANGRPHVDGPIALGGANCPGLALGPGTMRVAASSDATFTRVALGTELTGFGGSAGPARFSALNGQIGATGTFGRLAVRGDLAFDHAAVPAWARTVARAGQIPAGLPVTPTVGRATDALAQLLRDGHGEARLEAAIVGSNVAVRVRRAALTGPAGARIEAIGRGGLLWSASGWRADADVETAGGALPRISMALRQAAPGAALRGEGSLAPYRAGNASISAPNLAWNGATSRFAARLVIDGPIGDGFVRGLDLPLAGRLARGAAVIGEGCQTIALQSLQLVGFTFGPARSEICGRPLVAQSDQGGLRIDATAGPVRLVGHTASGVPVSLDAGATHIAADRFTTRDVIARVGDSQLRLASLDGRLGRTIGGGYQGATGSIANVPLLLSEGDGAWTLVGSTLALTGRLRVADAAASPRFLPLVSDDMRLQLAGGTVTAAAALRHPASGALVVNAALTHELAAGAGHATLDVPGITFAPKKLQPEALTPVTLGVVANVAGTIAGRGRIDWLPKGVTSSGSFGTERIDLAAAFGPASGIKGKIDFTDLLGLVSSPHQEATIAEVNPGVAVADGVVHFQLLAGNRVAIEDAAWPFAGGRLTLEPTTLDFAAEAERHLTFRVDGLDAAAFVQQLDFPNVAATGRFDGVLPMIFDAQGGRIEGGSLIARDGGGTLAYIGQLSNEDIGTMGKLAFDALKAIRYSRLAIRFDGRLDGEMISQVDFTGIRQATPDPSLVARLIRNLPFRFNIRIKAPFRGLIGSARAYIDPRLLLNVPSTTAAEPGVQPPASGPVR